MYYFYSKMMNDLDNGIKEEIAPTKDGKIVLKINIFQNFMGNFLIIVAGIFLLMALFTYESNEEIFLVGIMLLPTLLLLGAFCKIFSRAVTIEATSEKISYSNMRGHKKEMRWAEIKKISFNNATKKMTLESNTTKFKVHVYLKGTGSVLRLIKENVAPTIYRQAFNELGIY